MRTIIIAVLFLFATPQAMAQNYLSEVGTCKKARSKREGKRSPHIFFEIEQGKRLWTELATLRKDKKKLSLLDGKLKIKLDTIGWLNLQMTAAKEAVKAQKEQVKQLSLKIQRQDVKLEALSKDVRKWNMEAVKYKGQRYQFLVWGVAGGVVVTGVIVAVVSVLAFGGSK